MKIHINGDLLNLTMAVSGEGFWRIIYLVDLYHIFSRFVSYI